MWHGSSPHTGHTLPLASLFSFFFKLFLLSAAETRGLQVEPHQEVVGTVSPAFFSFFIPFWGFAHTNFCFCLRLYFVYSGRRRYLST